MNISIVAMMTSSRRLREYHSPRREERARRTRERIVAAATERFLESGYAATTMPRIAGVAGVAVQTVELAFGTKRDLLKAAIDVAIAGDNEPIPILERDPAAAAQSTAGVGEFLAIVGQIVAIVADRVAGLLTVMSEAATTDPEIAALARQLDGQRATMAAAIVNGIAERAPLRSNLSHQEAVDTIWLLMDPFVFRRLTRDRAWTLERFQRWFTDSAQRLLADPGDDR